MKFKPLKAPKVRQQMSPEVEALLVGFRPRFASEEDIRIANELHKVSELIRLANTDEERKNEIRRMTKSVSARRKEIEQKEKQLIHLLTERKRSLST